MFDRLAGRYDRFNRLASWGRDKGWRKSLVQSVLKSQAASPLIVDIGTGTGDLIFDLSKPQASLIRFVGLDLSLPMLEQAQAKLGSGPLVLQATAERIPLAAGSADVVISAFTLRNLKKIMKEALGEVHRILKPGGRFVFLEMYVPQGLLRPFHALYLKTALPLVGRLVFGASWAGDYLPETIFKFWSPEEFSQVLREAGFSDVKYRSLTGGIAVIHEGRK